MVVRQSGAGPNSSPFGSIHAPRPPRDVSRDGRRGRGCSNVAAAGVAAMLMVLRRLASAPLRRRRRRQPAVGVCNDTASSSAPPGRQTRCPIRRHASGCATSRRAGAWRERSAMEKAASGSSTSNPAPTSSNCSRHEDKVLAIGDLFGVSAGGQATTLVRLSSKTPWFAGFFGNAAAAAISAASTLGVTAVGSNGSPASGQ